MMNWENILKEDGVSDDFNNILDCLRKVRKLCAKYSDQNNAMASVEKMAHKAINELNRIDERELDDLYDPNDPNIVRINPEDEEFVPSRQYISSRGFEDRR